MVILFIPGSPETVSINYQNGLNVLMGGQPENSKSTIFNLVSTISLITTVFLPTITDGAL